MWEPSNIRATAILPQPIEQATLCTNQLYKHSYKREDFCHTWPQLTNLTELNSASSVSWRPLVAFKWGTRPSVCPSTHPPAAKLSNSNYSHRKSKIVHNWATIDISDLLICMTSIYLNSHRLNQLKIWCGPAQPQLVSRFFRNRRSLHCFWHICVRCLSL